MKKIVLISGIPSVGKSQLVNAARDYGAFPVSLEAPDTEENSLERTNLRRAWDEFFALRNTSFVDALNQLPADLILLEWGFPPAALPRVALLSQQGVRAGWLDGDRVVARTKHQEAGKLLRAFDTQLAAIEAAWSTLENFYGTRQIRRLSSDGRFLGERAVFERVFGKRMYHGSTRRLSVIAHHSCVSAIDYAAQ